MKLSLKKINKLSAGFTLVETLVAISIFTVSLLGVMTVLKSGIADISYAKQKMTATYLAQEGIEYIRNMRDTAMLYDAGGTQAGWDAFKVKLNSNSCNSFNNGCGFVKPVVPFDVKTCNQVNGCKLYLNNGIYATNAGGIDSGFVRKVWMTTFGGNSNEVKIFSRVDWTQGSGDYQITLSENLFKWVE